MTDFAAAGTCNSADFTDGVVGEVVVQIETFFLNDITGGNAVGDLSIFFIAESCDNESLGFTA